MSHITLIAGHFIPQIIIDMRWLILSHILELLITVSDEMSQIRQIRVYFTSSNYKGIETYLSGIMNM